MMFSAKLFTIVSAILAVAVNGSPVDPKPTDNGSPIIKPATNVPQNAKPLGNVHLCINPSLDGGDCKQIPIDANVCNNLADGYKKNISAFGPDQGIQCTLFAGPDCAGKSTPIAHPGTSDLANVQFDKTASSFNCTQPPVQAS